MKKKRVRPGYEVVVGGIRLWESSGRLYCRLVGPSSEVLDVDGVKELTHALAGAIEEVEELEPWEVAREAWRKARSIGSAPDDVWEAVATALEAAERKVRQDDYNAVTAPEPEPDENPLEFLGRVAREAFASAVNVGCCDEACWASVAEAVIDTAKEDKDKAMDEMWWGVHGPQGLISWYQGVGTTIKLYALEEDASRVAINKGGTAVRVRLVVDVPES